MADPGKPKGPPAPKVGLSTFGASRAPSGTGPDAPRQGSETGVPRRKHEPTLMGVPLPPDPGDPTTDPDVEAPIGARPFMEEAPPDLLQTDHGVRPASLPPPVPARIISAPDPTEPVETFQIEGTSELPPDHRGLSPTPEQRKRAARAATLILAAGGAVIVLALVGLGFWVFGGREESAGSAPPDAPAAPPAPVAALEPAKAAVLTKVAPVPVPTNAAAPVAPPARSAPAPASPVAEVELPPVPRSVERMRPAQRLQRAESAVRKAKRLLRRDRYDRAENAFRKALVYQPESAEAAYGMGRALAGTERYDEALAWATRATRLSPRDADPHVLLGDVLRHKGDLAGARAAYEQAQRLDPSNAAIRRRIRRVR